MTAVRYELAIERRDEHTPGRGMSLLVGIARCESRTYDIAPRGVHRPPARLLQLLAVEAVADQRRFQAPMSSCSIWVGATAATGSGSSGVPCGRRPWSAIRR